VEWCRSAVGAVTAQNPSVAGLLPPLLHADSISRRCIAGKVIFRAPSDVLQNPGVCFSEGGCRSRRSDLSRLREHGAEEAYLARWWVDCAKQHTSAEGLMLASMSGVTSHDGTQKDR
jgi:hypothetical protein